MQNRYAFCFVVLAVGMHPWGIIADHAQEKNVTSLRKKVLYGAIVTLAIGGAIYCFRPGAGCQSGGCNNIINQESRHGSPTVYRIVSGGKTPVVITPSMSSISTTRTEGGSIDTHAQSPEWTDLHNSDFIEGRRNGRPLKPISPIGSAVPVLPIKPALQVEHKDGKQAITVNGRTEITTLGRNMLRYLIVSEQERYLLVKQQEFQHALWFRNDDKGTRYYYESKINPFQADCGPCSIDLIEITPDRYKRIYVDGWLSS